MPIDPPVAARREPVPGSAFDGLVLRNFVKLGAGELISRLLGFAGTILIARQLGVDGYGVVGLGFAVLLYFAAVGDLGMEQLGPHEVARDRAPLEELASTMTLARIIASAIIAIVLAAIGTLFVTRPEGPVIALYGFALIAMGGSTRWVHVGLGRMGTVALSRFVIELTRVGLLAALVRQPDDLFRVPLIQFAGEAAGTVLLWSALRRRGVRLKTGIDTTLLRETLRRAFPLLLTNLLALVIYNSDIVVLRVFRDRAEVGLYLAAYTLINFLGVLGNTATLSILPSLSRLRAEPGRGITLVHRAQAQMMALGLPIAAGGALLATPILRLVFSAEYTPAARVLAVLVASIPLVFQRSVLQAVLISAGRRDRVLHATGWSAAVTIGMNFSLVPVLGMLGAGIATVAAETARLAQALRYARLEGYAIASPGVFWRSVVATAVMSVFLIVASDFSVFILIPVGAVVYASVFGGTGGFRLFSTTPTGVEGPP